MAAASMALDGEVRRSLLDRTDAEKVFRPWWDTLEARNSSEREGRWR